MDLKGKCVLVGVSGGIAAYKTAYLVSRLKKAGAEVHVIMTENACKFIAPLTFETLSNQECIVDTFKRSGKFDVEHVELAKKADVFIIAPATANVIAKIANGIADDMLTTTFLACDCKKIISPAMNTRMFINSITQDNLKKLKLYNIEVIEPANGLLACGDTGAGKMPEPEELYDYIERSLYEPKDLTGKKVLISAGATCESMDPVRFITNHSSGKMGFALAKECMQRGAEVTIVKASTTAQIPRFCNVIDVKSAEDMFQAITKISSAMDIIIMAAAVSDYTPEYYSDEKMKKKDEDLTISLQRTKDILNYLGSNRANNQVICGFSMETQDLLENSRKKLEKKNVDMIVANNLKEEGSGFATDTNKITIITKENDKFFELMEKRAAAKIIIDEIINFKNIKL